MSNPFAPPRDGLPDPPPEVTGFSEDADVVWSVAAQMASEAGRPIGVAAILAGCLISPRCAGWLQQSGHDVLALAAVCERHAALCPPRGVDLDPHGLDVMVRAQLAAGGPAESEHILRAVATPSAAVRLRSHLAGGPVDDRALLWWAGGLRGRPPAGPSTLARPGEAAVVLDLDEVTPFEGVHDAVVALGLSGHAGVRVAFWRATLGEAEVGAWPLPQAEEYAAALRRHAEAAGWPLQVRVVPPRA